MDNDCDEKIGYHESICRMIGCSGLDDKCPGNKDCSIIMKITHRTNGNIQQQVQADSSTPHSLT
jgi:hypothetical protein